MTRTAAARRERFLPYRYARSAIDLRVVTCVLDQKDRIEPDREGHAVDLDVPWTMATLGLELRVPSAALADVLDGPGELWIVLRCASTFLRRAIRIDFSGLDAPAASEITIHRDELAGVAELRAYLIRPAASAAPAKGVASERGARVADSRAWDLRIDRAKSPQGEHIDVRYERFSETPGIPKRDQDNLYRLEVEETPILWINADHERIRSVLEGRGTVGRHARIRELAFDQIAYSVWSQLFLRAARDYTTNEETSYPWQDAVLDLLLRDVFPEGRTAADRRDRLTDAWRDLPELLRRLDAALQRKNELAAHLRKLIEEEDGG